MQGNVPYMDAMGYLLSSKEILSTAIINNQSSIWASTIIPKT